MIHKHMIRTYDPTDSAGVVKMQKLLNMLGSRGFCQ